MKIILAFIFIVSLGISSSVFSEETPEQIVKRLGDLGPGVHEIKAEGGKLKSLKVVGQERISKVLGKAKGLLIAQKRATLKANAEFVDWMKNNATTISTDADETIVNLTGDGQNLSEQAKSTGTTKQEIGTKAEGLVRGLALVAKDQNPDTDMLTLVFSWSPEKAALAGEATNANNSPPPGAPSTPVQKDIPRKTVISPDFDN